MKRCPECRRDYFDETLFYCLDDGSQLVEGPAIADEKATAILPGLRGVAPTTKELIKPVGSFQSRRKSIIAVATLLLVLFAGVGYWFYADRDGRQIGSIAVLPFENGSGDAELDYLSDGVSESVINRLSQLPQLKVIPRSSSFRYREPNPDLKEIAKTLGVQAVVTGRFVPRGDSYNVRVELTDVVENKHLWGDSFTRKATELQLLQTDISRMVAENLRVRLTGTQTGSIEKEKTTNPQAYELLLKGRFWFNKAGPANFAKGAEFYEQAVAADPSYALAYAELSETYSTLGGGPTTPAETATERKRLIQKAGETAIRSLDLDPNLAEAHYALAGYKYNIWEWQEAEREFRRAFELSPNIARLQPLTGYAGYLSLMRRHDEAIADVNRLIEISPVSLIVTGSVAVVYMYARRFDEAFQASNRRLELDRTLPVPFGRLGEIQEARKMNNEAIAAYQEAIRLQSGDPLSRESIFLSALYAKMGERSKAEATLKKVESNRERVLPTYQARLYEALGRRDDAINVLEKAFAERLPTLPLISIDPGFDSMRSDPRFQDLLRRMGLPQ